MDMGTNGFESDHMDLFPTTLSPADLNSISECCLNSDSGSDIEPSLCYFLLTFPDAQFPAKTMSVVIGRDTEAQQTLAPGEQIWTDGTLSHDTSNKRKRTPEDDGSISESPRATVGLLEGHGSGFSIAGGIVSTLNSGVHDVDIEEQFLAIHPPVNAVTPDRPFTGISKRHLRIYWKKEVGWTLQVLGRNGAHHNGQYLQQGQEVDLKDDDVIGVRSLAFGFHLKGTTYCSDELDNDDDEDDEDSLTDSSLEGPNLTARIAPSLVPDDSPRARLRGAIVLTSSVADDDSSSGEDVEDEKVAVTALPKLKLKIRRDSKPLSKANNDIPKKRTPRKRPLNPSELLMPGEDKIPTKRGPGRPPKNGQMSQREMRERAKLLAMQNNEDMPVNVKGRVRRASPGNDEDGEPNGKLQASTKRRRSTTLQGNETTSATGDGQAVQAMGEDGKRVKGAPPPPLPTPPPREDYTEEQLMKPAETCQVRLCMILSEATGPMGLREIYEEMKNRWPYFRFVAASNGWQSSIRHNLKEEAASRFQKVEKEGRGSSWVLKTPWNPGMTRRRTSQPRTVPNYYPPSMPSLPINQAGPPYVPGLTANGRTPTLGYEIEPAQRMPMANGQAAGRSVLQPLTQYTSPYAVNLALQRPSIAPPSTPALNNIANPISNNVQGRPPSLPTGFHPTQVPSQQASRHPLILGSVPPIGPPVYTPNGSTPLLNPQRVSQPAQTPTNQGPYPPAAQQMSQQNQCCTSARHHSTAFNKILRGEVPALLTSFKKKLCDIAVSEAERVASDKQASTAIDWVMKNPYGQLEQLPEGDQKTLVTVIMNMLHDDHASRPRPQDSRASPVSLGQATPIRTATNGQDRLSAVSIAANSQANLSLTRVDGQEHSQISQPLRSAQADTMSVMVG